MPADRDPARRAPARPLPPGAAGPGPCARLVNAASRGVAPILLALLLALPSLTVGWLADDYVHRAAIDGQVFGHPGGWDLYDCADGDPARMAWSQDHGFPWWSAADLKVRFLRPLSSAMTHLDHRLAGGAAWPAHLLSALCYAGLVAGVWRLLRLTLPSGAGGSGGLAGLAALLYAVDDSHTLAVAWPSNRNAAVATALVVWGLVAWLRYRRDGWRLGQPLAWLAWLAALAAGEAALGAMALPGAYELCGGPEPAAQGWSRRARNLVPFAALGLAYAAVYKLGGYGAYHSAAYLDPLRETPQFLAAAWQRLPMLLGALVVRLPVEAAVGDGRLAAPMAAVGWASLAWLGWLGRRAWAWCDAPTRLQLRWLLLGSAASLLPATATFAAHRLLVAASIGAAALLALIFAASLPTLAAAWPMAAGPVSPPQRWAARLLAGLHLLAAPLLFLGGTAGLAWASHRVALSLRVPAIAAAAGKTAVLPAAPDLMAVYLPVSLMAQGLPAPRRWWTLSAGMQDCQLRVVDAHSIELRPLGGPWLDTDAERLFRSRDLPLRRGDRVQLRGFRVEVLGADAAGHPEHLRVVFEQRLDDPDLQWLRWGRDGVEPLQLPPVGVWLDLPRAAWLGL